MRFWKLYAKVFVITAIIYIIMTIYGNYVDNLKTKENQKTLFQTKTEELQAQDIIEQEIEKTAIKTISNLLNAYNNKDMTTVKNIDYRVKNNTNIDITQKYINTLTNCYQFKLHDIQIDNSSIYSISGFFTYSYLTQENKENTRVYSATNFIIKKINDNYMITYLDTKSFAPDYTLKQGVELAIKHGKERYGVENLLNLVFEE